MPDEQVGELREDYEWQVVYALLYSLLLTIMIRELLFFVLFYDVLKRYFRYYWPPVDKRLQPPSHVWIRIFMTKMCF